MAKHVQMQSIQRDPKTRMIVSRGKPRTFPPAIAAQMLQDSPQSWEVLNPAFDVPDDTRHTVPPKTMSRVPDFEAEAVLSKSRKG